ncbi:unnamed protein product [Lupinus luteus]|uniref:Uncharacterized protein n=1 Tax=Lupinus luteus TaxID=3873 RepID=A0AAV1WYE5_LUPLU
MYSIGKRRITLHLPFRAIFKIKTACTIHSLSSTHLNSVVNRLISHGQIKTRRLRARGDGKNLNGNTEFGPRNELGFSGIKRSSTGASKLNIQAIPGLKPNGAIGVVCYVEAPTRLDPEMKAVSKEREYELDHVSNTREEF